MIRSGRSGRIALGALLVLMLAVAVSAAVMLVHLREVEAWVAHTHKVIATLDEVEAATAEAAFAEHVRETAPGVEIDATYAEDVARVTRALALLRDLTAQEPSQAAALDRLGDRVHRGLGSREARGEIRATVASMVAAEERLLASRSGEQAETRMTLEALVAASAAGVLFAILGDFAIRRSEERRRSAEEERARLFDLSDELLCIAKYEGTPELNPAWEKILGFSRAEIEARTILALIHPDDLASTRASSAALLKGAAMVRFQNRLITKSGAERYIEWNAVSQPERAMIYATGRDVTAHHDHAARLETLTRELERSNRELQDFASVASHDLQEPLRKIVTFGDRLKSNAPGFDDASRDYIDRMQAAASRMQRLTVDLLAFSRIGARPPQRVTIDLAVIAREVTADLEARLAETQGTLLIGELPSIEADPTQMRQLLQNLIGNALKFHKPGEPPHVRVTGKIALRPQPVCEIEVHDGGIGFDEKHAERIFAVFQRLHGRSEYEGSGMGLAICRRIVERHGGTITARSKQGEGSTFIVSIPVNPP